MSSPPEVRWTPTTRDHVAFARLEGRGWMARRLALYTALLAGFLWAGLTQVEGPAAALLAGYIALLWGAIVVVLTLRPRMAVRRHQRVAPARVLTVEHRLSLHPWGALLEVDGARQTLPWDQLEAPRASGGYLLLATPPRGGVLVPRSAFEDDAALGRFAALAHALREADAAEVPPDSVLTRSERWTTWSLRFDLGEADYLALARDAVARRVRPRLLLSLAGLALIGCFGATLAVPDSAVVFVTGTLIGVLLLGRGTRRWWLRLLLPGMVRRSMGRHPARYPVGPSDLWLGPAGVVGRLGAAWHRVPWRHVFEVHAGRGHLFVYLAATEAFILPRSALGSDEEVAEVEAQLRAWAEGAPRGEASGAPLRAPAEAPDPFAPPGED